ncbi:hypothetical protein, secreted [gut metagenome]|uniref:Uncharacterized protein n=1 Tax=gut metagenome TaxID=749906 RepID=J9GR47_9ZZZZ
MIKKFFGVLLLLLGANVCTYAQNDAVTNQTVLDLLQEGFTAEEIIGAIENSSTRTITYDISFMRALKKAGATPELTTFLQKIAKKGYGI